MTRKLYHGGAPGLRPGQKVQPPSATGARSCADYDREHCRADRVYMTTDADEATIYAALSSGGGLGDVYEVEPVGELTPDPPGGVGAESYSTRAATVVAVVRRGVRPEQAAAQMRAFLLKLPRTSTPRVGPSSSTR